MLYTDPIPALVAPLTMGSIKLTDYADKTIVLVFYPFDFTSESAAEIKDFFGSLQDFQDNNCQV